VADDIDHAQAYDMAHRETMIAAHRLDQAERPSAEMCDECGDPIPEARRAALPGVRLCIFCQRTREQTR